MEWIKYDVPLSLARYFDAKRVGLRAVSNPEISVRTGAVVMQIRDVNGFAI